VQNQEITDNSSTR